MRLLTSHSWPNPYHEPGLVRVCPTEEEEWPSLQGLGSKAREVEILPEMAYYGRLQARVQVRREGRCGGTC